MGIRRNDQFAQAGEVSVRRRAGDPSSRRCPLHCRHNAFCEQLTRSGDQGVACAGFLIDTPGRLIWYCHIHYGTASTVKGVNCEFAGKERINMSAAVSIIRNDGEGERLWFYGGGVHTWKASSEETGGSLMLFEYHMSQGKATPLHVHANEDE